MSYFVNLFNWKRPEQKPETKDEVPTVPTTEYPTSISGDWIPSDDINDGNTSRPDWGYIAKFVKLDADRISEITRVCAMIKANQERYEVAGRGKVPWWWIGAIHYRESSLDFTGCLHNGDKVIGNGKLTTHVPKGRGPFRNWEDAAWDALEYDGMTLHSTWYIGEATERAERFNGTGYRRKGGEYSPYVTAGTNFSDETGKYTGDGKYSSTAKEGQLGVLAIWKGLGVI